MRSQAFGWFVTIAKMLGLFLNVCSWSAGWINDVLEYSSWFMLESTVNLKSISDQPLLPAWLLVKSTVWLVVELNKPAVDFSWINYQPRINLKSTAPYWLSLGSTSWIKQNSNCFILELSTRNQRVWLIQPHWVNSLDFSDYKILQASLSIWNSLSSFCMNI
jgi:hypothetical protein